MALTIQKLASITATGALATTLIACGGTPTEPVVDATNAKTEAEDLVNWQQKADEFLASYVKEFSVLFLKETTSWWSAYNTGKEEDFKAQAEASLAAKKLHSDKNRYEEIKELLGHRAELNSLTTRSLEVAELDFKGNQLPGDVLEKIVTLSSEIEQIFNSFRGQVDGKTYSNNELLEQIGNSKKSKKRKKIWEGLKSVGEAVAPKIIELAKLRNEAAKSLGYSNFWEMQISLQAHDPSQLMSIFAELEENTNEQFAAMKAELDAELAARFKIKPSAMMPWHYDNPFFQAPPASKAIDLDVFYKDKKKEDIVEIARKFFADVGLPIDDVIERSDLYEREGKSQHAFCTAIDREGDVRTLTNVKPTAKWMDTTLHEQGHAAYYKFLNYDLPYNLREAAHIFTTEGIAMLFGSLASNPTWLVDYAGADPAKVAKKKEAILEQRRREQLIFARWTMVMLHFEKALYENPDQDLNKLWWDYAERFQMLKRPANRNLADWASKPHFSAAPVYYHNYMLGELYAAQLRAKLSKIAGHKGSSSDLSFTGRKDFGEFLTKAVFQPGMTIPWPKFVENSTEEKLSAKFFAAELSTQ